MAISLTYLLAPASADDVLAERRDVRARQREGAVNDADDLLARLQSVDDVGAAEAFDTFVRLHYPTLCASAESYVGDRALAEEIADAVFARVWDRRRELRVRTTVAAYLFGAIRNASLNALAKRRFADRRSAEAAAANETPGMSDPLPSPQMAVEEAELRTIVWRAVASLPERARAILTLRWRMQLGWDEVADAMGMTANAVQVQHSRALAHLRHRLPELRELL